MALIFQAMGQSQSWVGGEMEPLVPYWLNELVSVFIELSFRI